MASNASEEMLAFSSLRLHFAKKDALPLAFLSDLWRFVGRWQSIFIRFARNSPDRLTYSGKFTEAIQFEGKKRMATSAFLVGYKLNAGDNLG